MKSKLTALFLSLLMVISYLPSSMITSYALPDESAETTQEQTNPVLILDKEFDVDDVFVYKIIDGSEYEKDAFGLISYSDSLKEEISEEYLEVDKFYDKILELFKDTDKLKDLDKESDSETFEVKKEKINEQSLDLYEDIKDYLDESKQLQFNKKHELNDLEEGVYFVLSDKYYPQLINVTDSDKEINIVLEENKNVKEEEVKEEKTIEDSITPEAQLPENKKEIKEENKEEKKENNTKASNKKGEPSRIAPSDTPGLATNVQVNKFDLEVTSNSGEFKDINGDQVYVITPEYGYSQYTLSWKLEYGLSATGSYPAESIEIRVPRYYTYKLGYDGENPVLNTTNSNSTSVVLSVPQYPNYNSSGFGYKYDSETQEYVITNIVEIAGGSTGFFEFNLINMDISANRPDEILQVPLNAKLSIQTGDEGLKTKDSNTVNWMFETSVIAKKINELLNNKYDTWQDEWGPAPADADNYFYVSYAFSGQIAKNATTTYTGPTQAYTIKIENSGWSNDFVYGWIRTHNTINTDSATGIQYSDTYYSSNDPVNSDTYKSIYKDNNIIKFDGNSIQDGVVYCGYSNQFSWYDGIVLARYPKSIQTDGEYDVTNTISMTVHPLWSNDEDTTVTYTRTDTLKNITFDKPEGNYSIGKFNSNGNNTSSSTVYILDSLLKHKAVSGIWYRMNFTASNYDKTVTPGQSLEDPSNYGQVNIHYEFIDDILFLSGDNQPLNKGDYEFVSIYPGQLKLYDYIPDIAQGKYVPESITVKDGRFKNFIESGALQCWGKYEDGWHKLATFNMKTASSAGWIIEDENLVKSAGSTQYSSTSTNTYLSIPKIVLNENTNCLGYKFTVDSSLYKISLGVTGTSSGDGNNSVVKLFPSNRVVSWAENHRNSTDGYLYNVNTLIAKDSNNNLLGMTGEFDNTYANFTDTTDTSIIKPYIDNLDTTLVNTTLAHDIVRTKILPITHESNIYKSYYTGTNDTMNEVYRVPYYIYIQDAIAGLSGEGFTEGMTSGELPGYSQYLIDNDFMDESTGCIFYDLLPQGLVVDENTISIKCAKDYLTDYSSGNYRYISNGFYSNEYDELSPEEFTYELIPNYKNSGRTLFKVNVTKPSGVLLYPSGYGVRMYGLTFTGVYSWDSFFDYGTTLRNIVGVEWGEDSIKNGYADTGNYSSFNSEEKEIMNNLDPNSDKPNFLYSANSFKPNAGVSGTSGLYKKVKGTSGDFESSSTVKPQSIYQYKIRYAAESGTSSSKLIFYDSLENYTPDNFSGERWKGKLQSIDISQLQSKGVKPTIYYSSIDNLDIPSHQDLTDTNTWTKAEDLGNDLSTVKAFAIDCTIKSNNDEFILGEKESLAIIVNMLSDVPNPNELFENETKAYNNIYCYNKVETLSSHQTNETLINQNYTSIGITVPTTKVKGKKVWKDENNSLRPESLTIELLRNGTPYREQTITAEDGWKFEFDDLLKQDDNLVDYEYTVREKVVPTGYTSQVDPTRAGGIAITFGNQFETESTTYDYVQIYYVDDNNVIKRLKGQGSTSGTGTDAGRWGGSGTGSYTLKNKTILVPSNEVYVYWHSDVSNTKYGFDVVNMESAEVDEDSIISETATLPNYTPIEVTDESNYPKTRHNYTDNEDFLWHYSGDGITGNTNLPIVPNNYTITNKQTIKSISGQKIWSDNSETTRPNNITVNLLRNGEQYQSKTVSSSNNWQYTFNNLPVFDDNDELYHYTISEPGVNGYTTRYSNGTETVETPTEGYNDIVNTWNPRVITITKQWLNSKGGDDTEFRPENITVHLVKKQNILQKGINLFRGDPVIDNKNTLENEYITDNTKWVKEGNTWTYTFSIPENTYDWEVYEEELDYYNESNLQSNPATVTDNAVTITNDFEPVIRIQGEKIWPENDTQYRPTNITVNLLKNGQQIDSKVVSAETNWKYDFGYQNIYDTQGNRYTYTLSENSVENYISDIDTINTTVTNTSYAIKFGPFYTANASDFLKIYYYDENNNLKQLTGQGSNSNGKWYGSSSYSLLNKTVYIPSSRFYLYWETNNTTTDHGFDITSIEETEIPSNISISSTTVTSLPIDESEAVLIDNNNLPRTAHEYSNNEKKLWKQPGKSTANVNITNILNVKNISGTKTWVDDNTLNRPESITVKLLQNGNVYQSKTVTAANNWGYEFTNLPIYDNNRNEFVYTISEDAVNSYSTTYSNGTETVETPTEGYNNIINTWNPCVITITKQWLNSKGGDDTEFRPENITVHLVRKQNIVSKLYNKFTKNNRDNITDDQYTINDEYITDNAKWTKVGDTWTYQITMPDNTYNWEVYEESVEYYNESNLIANPAKVENNTVTITNDFEPQLYIKGTKHWPEGDEAYRPESITVNLLRNNQIIDTKTVNASTNWKYDFGYQPVFDINGNKYSYKLTENELNDYIPIINDISNYDGYAIKFSESSFMYNGDYINIFYKDKITNTIQQLKGQGSNSGKWYGGAYSLNGKTLYVPSNEFYIYWYSNSSQTGYGFDVESITKTVIPDDITITSTNSTIPNIEPIDIDFDNLPKTTHDYGNNEKQLWKHIGELYINETDITNILNKQNISGTKTWVGDNASNRPESITVNLYQDGRKIDSQEVTADNNWSYTFTNVPIYKSDGSTKYEYYVEEEPVENYFTNYDKSHAGVKLTFGPNTGISSTNAYLSILYKNSEGTYTRLIGQGNSSTGQWNSGNISNLAGKTIEIPSLEFYLTWYGTGSGYGWDITNLQVCDVEVTPEITTTYADVNAINRTFSSFTKTEIDAENLPSTPHNYSNNTVLYHFDGTNMYKSLDLTNEWNLFNIEGTVRWEGEEGDTSRRPEKVTLDLYQNGILYQTKELDINDEYLQEFGFNNIPKKDSNGNEYHYEVFQRDINNYHTSNIDDLNILNVCTKRNITGYKIWINDEGRNSRPESIKVILYDENNNQVAEKIVTAEDEFRENCWSYTFENLDVFDSNGDIKEYHVEEEIDTKEYYTGYIPNLWYRYSAETQALLHSSAEDIYMDKVNLPYTIMNDLFTSWFNYLDDNGIYFPESDWEDLTNEQQQLFSDWLDTYLENLANKYFDENHLYGYDYYKMALDNSGSTDRDSKLIVSKPNMDIVSIVNVYRIKHIKGIKHWEDEGSQYQRPNSVTIGLYRDGEKIDEQVITADGNWAYEFLDLPEVKPDGTPYDYTIKEEPIDNYITEYNDGDLTEAVELTFEVPVIQKKYSSRNSWYQNNKYDDFDYKYGLVTVFKDGNTWYKMTLEEMNSLSPFTPYNPPAEKAAVSPSNPNINDGSYITFIVPSNEFYVIPVFAWGNFSSSGGEIFMKSSNAGLKAIAIDEDDLVPRLKSYRKVSLSDSDKAKLNYLRTVSRVEFEAYSYMDTFNYHKYGSNESGILFEKLGTSFDINDEVDNVLELKSMSLPYEFNEYTTNKTETYTYTDSQTGEEVTEEEVYERWVHNVGIHYKEQIGLTNYPLDATVDYSGYKVWNNNEQDEDVPDSPPYSSGPVAKSAKDKLTVKSADRVTQPDSVTVILLQDGQQYATQTIGEATDWKFEFTDLPKYDPTDHHAYEYSIKEKSVKGYQSIIKDNEGKNGHQVVLSSDILMDLQDTVYVLCHYNGNWYVCQDIPDAWSFADINNKLKLYIPGDDFKIFVKSSTYSQNEISDRIQDAINNGQNPENYIKIYSVKAIDIPYTINEYDGSLSYRTMNNWYYNWYQINLDNLPLPEYNTINIGDGSVNTITLAKVLEGYDDTNPDEQYNEFYNLYQYTSNNTEGIIIENTYYEGSFKIKKVDEQGRILPGCEFSLYYADGSTWTKLEDDPTAVQISDANGIVSFENIPYGDYLLYETKPANGYRTPSAPWKVSINTNGSATVWDENGKVVPIQGSDKEYDMSNGVRVTYNVDTDMPYYYLVIVAKNEETDSAVIYTLRGNSSDTYSKKSIDIPTKDFYIMFMNESGGSGRSTKSFSLSDLFNTKSQSYNYPYGFKVEDIKPIRTSWNNIYSSRNYNVYYDSVYDDEGMTWDQFFERSADMVDIINCNTYPESNHYEDFMEYVFKDKNTAWHYDASGIVANPEEFDNDALFEGTIITFGDNNHASTYQYVNPTYDGQYFEPGQEPSDYYLNGERYYRNPYIMFEYEGEYYVIELSNNPEDLNNFSMKIPSNNVWLGVSGIYRNEVVQLRGSTVPSDGSYSYDLGNEIIDVQSIAKTTMTKSDVENALNMSIETIPKQYESEFTPEFELTSGPQEIHWMTDVLGDNDAQSNYYYKAFYHYQNDASGLLPIYEIANELTRTETILVNTDDDPIPGGVLQIIDKEGHIVDSWETTDVNHITWGLTEGEEYTIHQVSTPYPYIVAEDDTFTVLIGETTYVKVINDKAKNVVISKTVSGNGSNPDDIFNYHLVISGGHPNVTHTVQMSNGNNTTVTTDANGNATLDFTLKHNETATVVGVFKDTNISVTESGNNYIASYKIDNNSRVINESANVDLSASATMVNDDISIAYENTITLVVPTSAYLRLKDMLPYILMGFCLLGMIIIYRKNRTKKLNLTK